MPIESNSARKKKIEDDRQHRRGTAPGDVELQERRRERRRRGDQTLIVHQPIAETDRGRRQHADQQRARHPPRRAGRRRRRARRRQQRRQAPESSPSVTSVPGESTIRPPHSKPIERNQQPDADRDRVLQRRRNRRNQALAQAHRGGQDEQRAGDRHRAERDLPRHLHADDDGEGEVEVVAHRRRDGDRVVRQQPHQQRRNGAGEAGGRQHRPEVHPGRARAPPAARR